MMTISLNLLTSKGDLGSKSSAIQTPYVHEPQEQSRIMLPLANTDLDSSLGKILSAHVGYTLSNQDAISSLNVADLTAIGIQEGTL